ncbi:MAG TPA: response regulator, partial [bacterium]|nr:response regulator [bacterium]
IEDDPDTLALLKENFKRAGYQVVAAETGEDGLSLFKRQKPDLVILDVILPGMDGWEVLRRIKSGPISRRTPVIMLTGQGEDADKLKGYEIGADFYVPKPFNMAKLLVVVRSMVSEQNPR